MTTVVSILISDIVPLRERGVWQGVINIVYSSGAGVGAPLGMLRNCLGRTKPLTIRRRGSRRLRWLEMVCITSPSCEPQTDIRFRAFLGQAPLCALAFAVVAFTLKLPQIDSSHWRTKLKRVDFLGAFVLICAVFTLLLGLDRGSNYSWKAPITIASLCVSFPLFVLFILVELKVAAEPFAPGRVIFEKSLFACYLCNFFSFGGWLAGLFYLPLYFQARGKPLSLVLIHFSPSQLHTPSPNTNHTQTAFQEPKPASAFFQAS